MHVPHVHTSKPLPVEFAFCRLQGEWLWGLWEAVSSARKALQMEAVTLVLIASLAAHLYFWPYQAATPERASGPPSGPLLEHMRQMPGTGQKSGCCS